MANSGIVSIDRGQDYELCCTFYKVGFHFLFPFQNKIFFPLTIEHWSHWNYFMKSCSVFTADRKTLLNQLLQQNTLHHYCLEFKLTLCRKRNDEMNNWLGQVLFPTANCKQHPWQNWFYYSNKKHLEMLLNSGNVFCMLRWTFNTRNQLARRQPNHLA